MCVSLDAWRKGEEQDGARTKRLAGSYAIAAAVVAALLAVGAAFGGQIKKQVLDEEVTVKFVPQEPVKAPEPPKPVTPPPKPKAAPKAASAAKGERRDAPPSSLPTGAPEEGDPANAKAEVPVGDPNGTGDGKGTGGGVVKKVEAPPAPPAPPPPVQQVAEVMTPPVPIAKALPAYPEDARKQGVEAMVVVKFVVDEVGAVSNVKILKGHPLFDAAVLAAVRAWRFEPATLDGKPVRMARMVKIPFRLRAG